MKGFTYASEPDQDGQVTIVEYGFDPETGRMRVVNAFQKTVKHFEVGGGSDGGSDGGGSDGGGSDGFGGSDGGGYDGGYGAGFDYDTSVSAPVETDAVLSGGDDLGDTMDSTNFDGLVRESFTGLRPSVEITPETVVPVYSSDSFGQVVVGDPIGFNVNGNFVAAEPTAGSPIGTVETQSAPPTAFGPTASMDFYSSLSDLGNVGRLAAYDTANALAGTGYGGLQQGTLGMTLQERANLESSLAREAMFEQNAKAFDTKDETKSGIGSFLSDPIAAIGGKIKDAIDNPVRSIVDLAFGQVPVIGQLNSISGLLGGPTVGGLVANPQQTLGLDISQSPYDLPGFDAYRDTTPAAMVAEEQGLAAGLGGYTQKDIAEMNNLVQETMKQEDQNNLTTSDSYLTDVVDANALNQKDQNNLTTSDSYLTDVVDANAIEQKELLDSILADVLPTDTTNEGSTVDTGVVDVGGGTGGVDDTTGGGGKNDTIVGGGKNDTIVGDEDKYSKYGIGVYRPRERAGLPYTAEVASRRTPVFGQAPLPLPVQPQPVVPSTNPFAPPPLSYSLPSFRGIASLPDMYRRRMAYPFPIS